MRGATLRSAHGLSCIHCKTTCPFKSAGSSSGFCSNEANFWVAKPYFPHTVILQQIDTFGVPRRRSEPKAEMFGPQGLLQLCVQLVTLSAHAPRDRSIAGDHGSLDVLLETRPQCEGGRQQIHQPRDKEGFAAGGSLTCKT